MGELREEILESCFDSYHGRFASGDLANNKLDLEILENSPLSPEIVARMCGIIRPYHPDLIVGTPKGANWLAQRVAWRLGESALLLEKDDVSKEFSYGEQGRETVERHGRLVIIDDVLNNLTNTGKVYDMQGVAERTVAIAGIWDRNPNRETELTVPIKSIIREEIPPMLPNDSPLWDYGRG